MNGQTEKHSHEFYVKQRKEMRIEDVREVERFDENEVVLETGGGTLTVEGASIRVETLDTEHGVVVLKGRVDGIYYSLENQEEKAGFLRKLFR